MITLTSCTKLFARFAAQNLQAELMPCVVPVNATALHGDKGDTNTPSLFVKSAGKVSNDCNPAESIVRLNVARKLKEFRSSILEESERGGAWVENLLLEKPASCADAVFMRHQFKSDGAGQNSVQIIAD